MTINAQQEIMMVMKMTEQVMMHQDAVLSNFIFGDSVLSDLFVWLMCVYKTENATDVIFQSPHVKSSGPQTIQCKMCMIYIRR